MSLSGTYTDISVDGAGGAVTAESVQGDINVSGGSGLVTLKSVSGDISLMKAKELGSWMECTTEIVISSGARNLTKRRSSTLSLQRDQRFIGEVLRLRSG